jgi:G:T/U-mismatch repair DNA glycosylase
VKPDDRVVILGTLHPENTERFTVPFFYGNRNTLWRYLSRAFPDELNEPDRLECILRFLRINRLAVSDVLRGGERRHSRSGDGDLVRPEYNFDLIRELNMSKIHTVLCMSGNHPKGAFGIFTKKLLGIEIDKPGTDLLAGIELHTPAIDHPLLVKVLPSPSGAANAAIAKTPSYKAWKAENSYRSIDEYRVEIYREHFGIAFGKK